MKTADCARCATVIGVAVLLLSASAFEVTTDKRVAPNDPYFRYQISFANPGGLIKIPNYSFRSSFESYTTSKGLDHNVQLAWAITTGSRQTVVAILDDGFFYEHEDLKDNIWQNPGETGVDASGHRKETNGLDDDGDGYIDDVVGWDFAFNDPDPDPYVFDGMDPSRIQPYNHGNTALGIIGAKGNNGIGIAGVNWNVAMMLLKIGAQGIRRGDTDLMKTDRVVEAIHFAVDHGARVINWSGYVDEFAIARRARNKIEALFSELRNQVQLRKVRLRGLRNAKEQFTLAATAQNVKRLIRFLNQPKHPVVGMA